MENNTDKIVGEIRALLSELRAKGLTEEKIEDLIRGTRTCSIIIDRNGITFPECGVKVRMTPMERTLYLLILRHEEGIPVMDIWRHHNELCRIYGGQTVFDDPELIRSAVDALCDGYKTTLYTNVSRIRRKLTDRLGKVSARPYMITRDNGGRYVIPLDRTLVTFA